LGYDRRTEEITAAETGNNRLNVSSTGTPNGLGRAPLPNHDAERLHHAYALAQKKCADAKPLLLAGYEGLKQREKTIPPQGQIHLPEALDRLIEL